MRVGQIAGALAQLNKFGGSVGGMRAARARGRFRATGARAAVPRSRAPRARTPPHFLSRHKGRFKYFGMLPGDISPVRAVEPRNAASGIRPHALSALPDRDQICASHLMPPRRMFLT